MKWFKKKKIRFEKVKKPCVKFITDESGRFAQLYINGKKIDKCTGVAIFMDLEELTVDYTKYRQDKEGHLVIDFDKKEIKKSQGHFRRKQFLDAYKMTLKEAKEKLYPEYKYAVVNYKSGLPRTICKDYHSALTDMEEANKTSWGMNQVYYVADLSEV